MLHVRSSFFVLGSRTFVTRVSWPANTYIGWGYHINQASRFFCVPFHQIISINQVHSTSTINASRKHVWVSSKGKQKNKELLLLPGPEKYADRTLICW
jgi:hypothetical protein